MCQARSTRWCVGIANTPGSALRRAVSVQNCRKSLWISAQTPVWRGFQHSSLPHWPLWIQLSAAADWRFEARNAGDLLPLSVYPAAVTAGDLLCSIDGAIWSAVADLCNLTCVCLRLW